jgi:hypothetical protein
MVILNGAGECHGVTELVTLIQMMSLTLVSLECSINKRYHTKRMYFIGVTRYYNFSIGYATLAPDGVEKQMIVINDQFPG